MHDLIQINVGHDCLCLMKIDPVDLNSTRRGYTDIHFINIIKCMLKFIH